MAHPKRRQSKTQVLQNVELTTKALEPTLAILPSLWFLAYLPHCMPHLR